MPRNQLSILEEHGLASIPIERVQGRELITAEGTFIDFCGTNYLSFEFHPRMLELANDYAARWGTLCGWSRLEADPVIYRELEERISRFLKAPDVLLSHTITLTCFSVIPGLVQKGAIFADQKVHTVVWESCRLARDHGAQVVKFEHQNVNQLEDLLKKHSQITPKLVVVDGVYSLSSAVAPIRALQAVCRAHDAWLFVDDAHGFGILGEAPTPDNPYGVGGNGVVAHFGGDFRRTFYTSSFGKAFSTHTSFIVVPEEYRESLPSYHLAHIFSAPVSAHTTGTVAAALELNEASGEQERAKIRELVNYFYAALKANRFKVENYKSLPILFVPIGNLDSLVTAAKLLKQNGILTGLRASPIVPETHCGVRFALSSIHTKDQIDKALEVLTGKELLSVRTITE